jgi:hypothetical protein
MWSGFRMISNFKKDHPETMDRFKHMFEYVASNSEFETNNLVKVVYEFLDSIKKEIK